MSKCSAAPPGASKHARRGLFLLGMALAAIGCVSPRDIRVLQSQLDELHAEQQRMAGTLTKLDSLTVMGEGSTRSLVVDMKSSLTDMDVRLSAVDARLADLESRSATGAAGTPAVIGPSPDGSFGGSAPEKESPAAQDLYEQAFEALKQENHAAAITGFRAYLQAAPAGTEAASAVFWIGESFAALGQSDSALVQYQVVLDRYPQSAKVPAALLKSGNLYDAQGQKDKAYPYYRRLKEEYPQSLEYQQLRRQLEE
jgi:tol-pal system protein YbgF